LVCNHIFDLKSLLEDNPFRHGVLDREFDFDSSRMGFRPYEACVDDSNFV
jgi:hypothetical protein